MIIKNLNKIKVIMFFCCAFAVISSQQLLAQAGVQGTQPQVIKWMSVSGLRSWFSNFGAEGEYFRRDRTTYVAQDQIDGLLYPGEYNNRMKGVKISKGLWIGATNFADPVSNITYPHKVVSAGPAGVYTGTEIIADETFGNTGIQMIGKFDHPNVYVDNTNSSIIDFTDEVDAVDDNLLPDRMLVSKFHTSMGVTVTRKILAFSQQYHDNYYIYEYTLKNTGIIDESGEKKLNNTLTDVRFYLAGRYSFAGESYSGTGVGDWFPAASSWGRNTIIDVVGQDENHPNDFRAMFAYYGPVSGSSFGSPAGDIGLPGPNAVNVWTLAGTQFAGVVVLHADTAPGDTTDDELQPTTTLSVGADAMRDISNNPAFQYNQSIMTQKYNNYIAAGDPGQTQAEQVGKDPVTGMPTAYANTVGTDPGGFIAAQGFGTYTLAPGDSIRIVLAEAISGISRDKTLEVAENWFENNTSAFDYPAGYTGPKNDRNDYKNAWVFSGKDSLFQTFRRAIANYNNNYNMPQPPQPPDNFEVNSGGDRIGLAWSNNAEVSNFDGYRLYRAEGRSDTVFTLIKEWRKSKGDAIANTYDDKNAIRGFNYYYYIQSIDDGSTNDIQPGVPLVSSKYYTMTSNPAFLTRPAGYSVTSTSSSASYISDGLITDFILPESVADSTGTIVRGVSVTINGISQIPATYAVTFDTLRFIKAPVGNIDVEILSPTGERTYKLSDIRIVPNPFNLKSRNIQFGELDATTLDRLAFYNLPPVCTIRIYTETGDLIETIDHTNGSGDDYWNSLTSSRQVVVSGLYIAYFEVTEDYNDDITGELLYRKGDSIFKKFIIIR